MSLIIDALKKTQQLRVHGTENAPLLMYPAQNKTGRKNSKKQWIVTVAGLLCLCILLFVFLRPPSSPFATQTNGTIVPLEKTPFMPVAEKATLELPREASNLPKDEVPPLLPSRPLNPSDSEAASKMGSIQRTPNVRAASRKPPSNSAAKRMPTVAKSSVNEAGEEAQVEQDFPPSPATRKEEVSLRSIAVEQEGKKDPSPTLDVLHHFNSGVIFHNQKEFVKAIQAYQKVIELDPANFEAYNNLGIIYQALGNTKKAFSAYQKSTEINPGYEKGYNNLGLLFLLEGRYEEAMEVFQKALGVNANNIESHINLGILFKKKGQGEKAIESYQKALAINPLQRESHYNMALLYEQLEKWELAINHYQQFIQLSSTSYPGLVLRVQRRINALTETKGKKNSSSPSGERDLGGNERE